MFERHTKKKKNMSKTGNPFGQDGKGYFRIDHGADSKTKSGS